MVPPQNCGEKNTLLQVVVYLQVMRNSLSPSKIPQQLKSKFTNKSRYYQLKSHFIVTAFIGNLERSRNNQQIIHFAEICQLIHSYYKLLHRDSIKYKKGDIYIKFTDKLNASYSSNGTLLNANCIETVEILSHLSGIPAIIIYLHLSKLYLKILDNPDRIKVSYHQCVTNKYKEKPLQSVMGFYPLDGNIDAAFNVLSYDIKLETMDHSPLIMVQCEQKISPYAKLT